jgi:hypothetical protein
MTMTNEDNTQFFDSITGVELAGLMCNAVSALIKKQGLTDENRALAARTIRTIADTNGIGVILDFEVKQ